MIRKRIVSCVIGIAMSVSGQLLLPSNGAAQPYALYTIDIPCTACPGGIALSTSAQGVNPGGDIVGWYTDNHGTHGYRLTGYQLSEGMLTGGDIVTLDVPGSLMGVGGTLPTSAAGISPSGDEIAGNFTAPFSNAPFGSPEYCTPAHPASCIKGFLYSHGQFSTLLFPLPSGGYHPGAVPQHITPDGDIYGCLHDNDTGTSMFGAAWTRLGDPLAAIGMPMSMHHGAAPDGQTIVGHWSNATGTHGYIIQNGNFQSWDVPGSNGTAIEDINAGGVLVGVYHDTRNHGFVQLPDGSPLIAIDPLDSIGASVIGINAGGMIVGQYTDTNKHLHGFIAVPMAGN